MGWGHINGQLRLLTEAGTVNSACRKIYSILKPSGYCKARTLTVDFPSYGHIHRDFAS
jgi:hypothetical protein